MSNIYSCRDHEAQEERMARDIEIERLDKECQQLRDENENLKVRLAHSDS